MINLNILKGKNIKIKNLITIVAAVVFLCSIGYLGFYYYKTQKELSAYKESSQAVAIKEMNELIKKVGKLTLLPQNETPTVATIADAFRLKGQKFFSQVEDGDKLIIYKNSQRIILYRPSLNKIIETSQISVNDLENTIPKTDSSGDVAGESVMMIDGSAETVLKEPEKVEPQKPAKLAIYNGTLYIEGLATKVGAYLVKEIPGNAISVEILKNADEIYDETIVIDVTQKYNGIAKQIKEKLSAKLEEKPGEVEFPDVDIVIIAGTDLLVKDLE